MKFTSSLLTAFAVIAIFTSFNPRKEWTNMLDKNLSHWDMYLSYRHTPSFNGSVPKDEKGQMIPPIGYHKNTDSVFSVAEENGSPVLRISGEIYGCLFTREEFENYHLRLKVKWGTKKWIPRNLKLRDSGICYYSTGECGKDFWLTWMLSQEFQIMEGHMGDYWNIANSAIDVKAFMPEGSMNPVADNNQPLLSIGPGTDIKGFCLRTLNNESPAGEWTEIDLVCFEGKSLHIVNGKVVMVLMNSRYHEGDKDIPLTKGKIQLQSEGAEVFYKDIQIEKLTELPGAYASYFKK